jgi:hypothetical protein
MSIPKKPKKKKKEEEEEEEEEGGRHKGTRLLATSVEFATHVEWRWYFGWSWLETSLKPLRAVSAALSQTPLKPIRLHSCRRPSMLYYVAVSKSVLAARSVQLITYNFINSQQLYGLDSEGSECCTDAFNGLVVFLSYFLEQHLAKGWAARCILYFEKAGPSFEKVEPVKQWINECLGPNVNERVCEISESAGISIFYEDFLA